MRAPESVRPAPAGPGNEPPKTSCLSVDGPENKLGEQAAQEATAAHAADEVLLGDDVGAEREIRLAISHLRSGAAAFRKMQGTFKGIADAIRAEAVL
jgi:hypothetical protein